MPKAHAQDVLFSNQPQHGNLYGLHGCPVCIWESSFRRPLGGIWNIEKIQHEVES